MVQTVISFALDPLDLFLSFNIYLDFARVLDKLYAAEINVTWL